MNTRSRRLSLGLTLLGLTIPLAAVAGSVTESGGITRSSSAAKSTATTPRANGGANEIYNNFGAGDSFNIGLGWTISSQDSNTGTDWDQGESFTVPSDSDYTLDKIDIAMTLESGTNRAEVSLMTDSGGQPGSVLETFIVTGMGTFGQANPPITLNSTGTVLSAGTTYWIIAHAPEGSGTHAVWNQNDQGDTGPHAQRQNLGSWNIFDTNRGAFRVCATPSTGGPCPLVATLNAIGDHVGGLLAKSSNNKSWQLGLLADLRSYRDSMMKASDSGRELTQLYYRHGAEMTRLLKQNPVLAWRIIQVVSRAMPAIRTATNCKTSVAVDSAIFHQGLELMTEVERLASDDLQKSLRSARRLLGQHAVVKADRVVLNLSESNSVKVVAVD